MEATYIATQGMIEYRLGKPEIGRVLDENAREVTRKQKNLREEVWSMLFQAREEQRFDAYTASNLLTEARKKIDLLRAREAAVATRLLEIVSD